MRLQRAALCLLPALGLAQEGFIAAPGIPGNVNAFGPEARVLAVGRSGGSSLPVVASARFGDGLMVVFGHDGYLNPDAIATGQTGDLLLRALGDDLQPGERVALVEGTGLESWFDAQGFDARPQMFTEAMGQSEAVVLAHRPLNDGESAALLEYVHAGGVLIAACTGWGWEMITGGAIADFPLNRVLVPAGLAVGNAMLDRTHPEGFALGPVPRLAHAGAAYELFVAARLPEPAEEREAIPVLLAAAVSLPAGDSPFRQALADLVGQASVPIPSGANPVGWDEPLNRLALALTTLDTQRSASPAAHPAAEVFPGAVPAEAERVSRTVALPAGRHGWLSLGLYAAPGEAVKVQLSPEAQSKGLAVRIGSHTDSLWHLDAWERAPEVSRQWALEGEETTVQSGFGGLVYLVMPEGADLGGAEVTVSGVVEAPLFLLGQTDAAEWARLRNAPGPWAEIGSDKVIVTVPSSAVRGLDDPAAVARFWDEVADAIADLAGRPRARTLAERMVADQQISAGYMHSGYPIMTHLDVQDMVVDAGRLRSEGSWGHFHELGHNHQSDLWTFEGTVEVTVNLFSMYVYQEVCGFEFDQGHPAIADRAARLDRVRAFVQNPNHDQWMSDPFLALSMYIQLIEAFGWDSVKDVIASYRGIADSERPRTEQDKRDQWMVRYSRVVGRDLGPFFELWGVPVTDAARAEVAALPDWLPEELSRE